MLTVLLKLVYIYWWRAELIQVGGGLSVAMDRYNVSSCVRYAAGLELEVCSAYT